MDASIFNLNFTKLKSSSFKTCPRLSKTILSAQDKDQPSLQGTTLCRRKEKEEDKLKSRLKFQREI
jgi:hypothetical protein